MDHINTAVSMCNAGDVLQQEFVRYDQGTEEEKARRRSLIIPMVVVYAFGIEVALKAIIKRQGETPDQIHDLLKLYEKIPVEAQENINERVSAIVPNVSDVQKLLKEHQESFVKWRYLEDFDGPHVVSLGALQATLRATIEECNCRYGTESKKESVPQGQDGVPKAIQNKATQYAKDVFDAGV